PATWVCPKNECPCPRIATLSPRRFANCTSFAMSADFDKFTQRVGRGDLVERRQVDQLDAPAGEKGVIANEQAVGPLAHESCKGRFDLRTGAGFENLDLQTHGESRRFHVSQRRLYIRSICWIDKDGNASGSGHKFAKQSQSFCGQLANEKVNACQVPPGRPRLDTRPSLTGSSPTMKTMGVVAVAPLAANAEAGPPFVAITATRRRTSSAASAGRRSYCPSAQRYSIDTFSPST